MGEEQEDALGFLYTDVNRDWDEGNSGGMTSLCHRIIRRTPARVYVEAWAPWLPVSDSSSHRYVGNAAAAAGEVSETVVLDRLTLERVGVCRSKAADLTFYVEPYEQRHGVRPSRGAGT